MLGKIMLDFTTIHLFYLSSAKPCEVKFHRLMVCCGRPLYISFLSQEALSQKPLHGLKTWTVEYGSRFISGRRNEQLQFYYKVPGI